MALSRRRVETRDKGGLRFYPVALEPTFNVQWVGGQTYECDVPGGLDLGAGATVTQRFPVPYRHRLQRVELMYVDAAGDASEDQFNIRVYYTVFGRDTLWFRRDNVSWYDGSLVWEPGMERLPCEYVFTVTGTANYGMYVTFTVEVLST